jgi:hypothetical protein
MPRAPGEEICLSERDERAKVVSSSGEIESLSATMARLWPEHRGSMLDPTVFLATIDASAWIPRIIIVGAPDRVSGAAYFKERRISRFGAGLLYGDATMSPLVLADPPDRKRVLRIALQALLSRRSVWGLRILVPPDSYELEAIRETSACLGAALNYGPAENHWTLPLARGYQAFLGNLGPRTRRNFRYYRRRFTQSGHAYVRGIELPEFAAAASGFLKKSVVGADAEGIRRALQVFSAVKRPLLAGLRHRNGQWLSILGGWRQSHDGIVFFQMNDDQEHAASSLSVVMRGYLIEDLISEGVQALHFWGGIGDPLRRSCLPVPAMKAFLDKRSLLSSGIRTLLLAGSRLFPTRLQAMTEWIAWNHKETGPAAQTGSVSDL